MATRSAGPTAAERTDVLPVLQVSLASARRTGLLGGLFAVFVSAVGMVVRFRGRGIVVDLSLGTLLPMLFVAGSAYLAGRPPPAIEGFAPPRRGARNLLAASIAGLLAGGVLAVFVAIAGTLNLRRILLNVSPELIEVLTFGQGVGRGILIILAGSAGLAAIAGVLHLLPDRWRRGLTAAVVWVLSMGLLQPLIVPALNSMGIAWLRGAVFSTRGGVSLLGAAVVALVAGVAYLVEWRAPGRVRARIRAVASKRRTTAIGVTAVVTLALVAILPSLLGTFLTEVLNFAGIFLLMALGLNIVVGLAGLLDLGYVAFFAVGAYTTAVLTSPGSPGLTPEITFWAALPFVVLAASLAGLTVGTPVLRMRGDYLAIVTLGFGEIARLLFLSDALKPTFGGAQGITRIPDIVIGPVVVRGPAAFFYTILAFVLVAAYMSHAVQDSRIGRAWMAMREDETVAEAMGVNIVAAKLWAFVIGAILAGFGGALFAVKIGSIFPHSFSIIVSITVLVVIIVGGLASMPGVVLGALVLVGLPEVLREFEEFKFLIYGALLIFMMLKRPEGFIPSRRRAQELHEEETLQDAWLQKQAGTPAVKA